ncbi:MAG: hypothetical protein OHK0013_33930 [Sandaracinaceae bacterium]
MSEVSVDNGSRKSVVAMQRWVELLAVGGVVEARGAAMSGRAPITGAQIAELEAWLASQPAEVRKRERQAAIEVCIWMANADRNLDADEAALLKTVIDRSGLDDDTKDSLVSAVHDPPSLVDLEERLTHPVLRELLLFLAWELANADGNVARAEAAFFKGLAKRLGVSDARAAEIQAAV